MLVMERLGVKALRGLRIFSCDRPKSVLSTCLETWSMVPALFFCEFQRYCNTMAKHSCDPGDSAVVLANAFDVYWLTFP